MSEWLRLVLLIGLGGAAVTLAAALAARLLSEQRRLTRTFRKGLDGPPDAALIAHGTGRGVALSLAAGRIVTAWEVGAWRLTYPLEALLGAELDLDGQVAARAMRGEPRRRLDRQSGVETEVRLRFLFDDARHPDFELTLWPHRGGRGAPGRPREAIAEANRWIARVEALLRRSDGARVLAKAPAAHRPAPPPGQIEVDLFEEDEDAVAD